MKKERRAKKGEEEKEKKGNLTRFKIVDIYDDIPCVCAKFTTQTEEKLAKK